MVLLQSFIFRSYPEIMFGFSTKIGLNKKEPFYFNTSLSVGDDEENVIMNRNVFYKYFNLTSDKIVLQKQTHSDNITIVNEPGVIENNDALITNKEGLGLVVSSADCCPVFIYEKKVKVIAAIHSGWRGTQKEIVKKTVLKMKEECNCNPEEMIVYMAPSINEKNYEVGEEVAKLFSKKYLKITGGKFYLDVAGMNYNLLRESGIRKDAIQQSKLCTYEMANLLHSYRGDGSKSGRAFGLLAMKKF